MNEDRLVPFVAKLIQLTKRGKLKWENARDGALTGFSVLVNKRIIVVMDLNGPDREGITCVLRILTARRDLEWQSQHHPSLDDLWMAALESTQAPPPEVAQFMSDFMRSEE